MSGPGPERHDPLPGLLDLPAWARRNLSRTTRRLIVLAGLGLAIGLAIAVPLLVRAQDERQARSDAEDRALRAARRRELVRVQRPHALVVRADRGRPAALTRSLEAAIVADATRRQRAGELPDRIVGGQCSPFTASTAPVRAGVLILECLALTGTGGTGYPFRAVVEVRAGSLVWCRNVPVPAHPDSAGQVPVALSARCTGALSGRAPR